MIISNCTLQCMHFLIGDSYSIKNFPRIDTPRRIIYDHAVDKYIVATARYQDSIINSEVKLICSEFGTVKCSFSLMENETIESLNSKM